jgi:hydrogenase-4 component F
MQQIVSHCVTKSFCFFAAGTVLLTVGTRQIASVRGLIRQSPIAGAALVFGGLAIAGAPPMAVFLSEFSILKAGLTQKHYVATGLLAVFIVIAFFGIMLHVNRMVFGARENGNGAESPNDHSEPGSKLHLPLSCRLALILAAVPVLVLGFYIPQPLHDLLTQAAAALTK